jgi:hypothetical protein
VAPRCTSLADQPAAETGAGGCSSAQTGWQHNFWRSRAGATSVSGDEVTLPMPTRRLRHCRHRRPVKPVRRQAVPTPLPAAPVHRATGAARNRSLLPTGVRLQIDLPEGRITRDVLLPPTP